MFRPGLDEAYAEAMTRAPAALRGWRAPAALRGCDLAQQPSGAAERMQAVPYDQGLADRLRNLLSGEPGLTEKKMFGGLAFLVGGNMAIAASGHGGLMVRVDPAQSDTLASTTPARIVEMRGPRHARLAIPGASRRRFCR